jgi:hypothetical protein
MIEILKSVTPHDSGGMGPMSTTTIGFKCGDDVYILGSAYEGPYCCGEHVEWLKRTEAMLRRIAKARWVSDD